MSKSIKLKINAKIYGRKVGDIISVECDDDGVPFNQFWRRRLADSVIDNCVEIVTDIKDSKNKEGK